MKKQILVTPKIRKEVVERIGIKYSSLALALAYQRNGELSERARQLALELGGEEVCISSTMETIHDADGRMVQVMPNGATVISDKETGDVRVEYRGDVVAVYPNARISTLKQIQALAAQL